MKNAMESPPHIPTPPRSQEGGDFQFEEEEDKIAFKRKDNIMFGSKSKDKADFGFSINFYSSVVMMWIS